MSFAFLAFYTGDYFRDTRGLSMAGHGCYFLLLTYCWDSKGPLPLDEERIAGICEARSQDERHTMNRVLNAYFVKMEDGWYNRRMQREIERAHAIGLKRKAAGAKGFQAKAKHLPSKSQASAEQVPLPSPPPPPPPLPNTTTKAPRASALRSPKTPIPENFAISDRVRNWATEKGYGKLQERFEHFVGVAKAKAYVYADWDEAFMGAIRKDWAELGGIITSTRKLSL